MNYTKLCHKYFNFISVFTKKYLRLVYSKMMPWIKKSFF